MKNSLVVYVEPSRQGYPGHMVVGQEGDADDPKYYGFRFDPADLKKLGSNPRVWWQYLGAHVVPGTINRETAYMVNLMAGRGQYREKRTELSGDLDTVVPQPESWRNYASYSFNPDDFNTEESPCYNCVTWASGIANELVDGFLPIVRQGRIGLIFKILDSAISISKENS